MTTTILNPETIDLEKSRSRAWSAAKGAFLSRLTLPPKLTLSEWADRYRVLSPESSADPGQWQTSRVPYLREIMDTISGTEYQDITILKSSQTGGTEVLN
ncbi:MAG: phage terminase large subunit family protein, partial [Gemmatimonadales bacterium]